jgi:putative hydrolase of the HAD superfamily
MCLTVRAVLLDAAGTLIDPAEPVGETYSRIARSHGGELDPQLLHQGFRTRFAAMPPLAFPPQPPEQLELLERGWWRGLVSRIVADAGGVPRFDDYFDELYAHYARGEAWRPYPEVTATLLALRERGLALAVVSNFDSRLPGILEALELAALVDEVVWSTGAGRAKPDPGIFHAALARLGIPPQHAVHVGDSRQADYEGARNAGLHARLVARQTSAPSGDIIPDLGHLLDGEGIARAP